MNNPYSPPQSNLEIDTTEENNSGGGKFIEPPPGVTGWSWGAFCLGWIWAVFNRVWIGLFCFVPYLGWLMVIYLGVKGRELAWRNKEWKSLEHFNEVQRRWSVWGGILFGVSLIGVIAAVALPAYQKYKLTHGG